VGVSPKADLRVGNFSVLPWEDQYFDVVVDIFALYANTLPVIYSTLAEIARVLKPDGVFYTKLWGPNTTGYGSGHEIEPNTFDAITSGPGSGMGVIHFFDREEIDRLFGALFTPIAIDMISRSDVAANQHLEEFHCQFRKKC